MLKITPLILTSKTKCSRTKNQPKEEVFGTDTPQTSGVIRADIPAQNQRIAKGAGGKGPRQKSSKSVKKFFDTFRQFSRRAKNVKNRQKASKSFSTLFDNFRAAPFFRPLLGGSDKTSVRAAKILEKNKHFGADIHDPKARTSTTLRDFQNQKNVRNPNHHYFSKKYRNTPPICIAIRLQFVLQCFWCPYALRKGKYCQYSSHLYRSTPPICIAIRLPFVSQYFWENLGGCGATTVVNCHNRSIFSIPCPT